MKVRDVDPKIKRLFPWSLFLVVAALFLLATCQMARAQEDMDGVSCEQVVQRVGMKPLWLAERDARRDHPELTERQIAWGRKCVTDHRRALLKSVADKVKGMF